MAGQANADSRRQGGIHSALSRRQLLARGGMAALAAAGCVPGRLAIGAEAKVRLGLLMTYSGVYAPIGLSCTDGFKLGLAQAGNKLGGRDVQIIQLDDAADPERSTSLTRKLIVDEAVDFLIGPTHSGVGLGMVKMARDEGTIALVSNAGSDAITGALCAPNIFRTSFSNWQVSHPCGRLMWDNGHRRVVTMAWDYTAGLEDVAAFTDSFSALGGVVAKEIMVPFPEVEFQSYLRQIASLNPDAVFVFFAGDGAVKFLKEYAAAGLKATIPLYGPGFLTEGLAEAGEAGEGVLTTLHYADNLDTTPNRDFRAAFRQATGREADVYAVQGFDTAALLVQAMAKVQGDTRATAALIAAMEDVEIDSPRGRWRMSKAHNPIQDIYLRRAEKGRNTLVKVALPKVVDPAFGCRQS